VTLTSRQRLLTVLRHGVADRLPWAPKFNTWFKAHVRRGDLPELLRGCEHWHDAARRIGVEIFDKHGPVLSERHPSVQLVENSDGCLTITRYLTPVGEFREVRQEVEDYAHTIYLLEYPIKSPQDLRPYRYYLEDTVYEPSYDEFLAADRDIGDDGLTMAALPDSPLHRVYVHLMGYEVGSFAFADVRPEMDDLCRLILQKNEDAYAVAMASPAEVLLTPENTNSDFESPDRFRRYAFPTLQRASELAHAHGKLHWVHACGKLKALLPQFLESGIDGVESLTPPPYANTPLDEARAAWNGQITIDGGISPHLLVDKLEPEELEHTILDLFERMAPGNNFVLSVSDDTPTNAKLERIIRVGELVREYGRLPLARGA
jgi:hypothetical protein